MHLKLREDSTVHNLKGHDAEMKTCALTFHSYPDANKDDFHLDPAALGT